MFASQKMAPCLVCQKNVTRKDWGVNCYICGNWYHLKTCTNLSTTSCDLLTAKKSDIIWKCQDCSAFSLKSDKSDNSLDKIWNKIDDVCSKLDDLTKSIATIVKKEVDSSLKTLQEAIQQQTDKFESFRADITDNIMQLEKENHKIRYQLCRNDVLVSGLPRNVTPLEIALKIPKVLGVDVKQQEINSSFWLGKEKKTLLIKFVSTITRDLVMKKYMSGFNLKLKQLDSKATSNGRVYLNDNLPPAGIKIKNICRNLLKENKIQRFRVLGSIPAAKITDAMGHNKFVNIDDLNKMQQNNTVVRRRSQQPNEVTPRYIRRPHNGETPRNSVNNIQHNDNFATPNNGVHVD